MSNAIGFIETKGYVAAFAAADAMDRWLDGDPAPAANRRAWGRGGLAAECLFGGWRRMASNFGHATFPILGLLSSPLASAPSGPRTTTS
jgi:hypothetical protein